MIPRKLLALLALAVLILPAFAREDYTQPLRHDRAHWNANAPQLVTIDGDRQSFAAIIPQRLESVWTSGGVQHHVITDRHDNEAIDTWAKRHKEAVQGVIQYFPPDSPQHFYGAQYNWIQGTTVYSEWVWQDHDTGDSFPTTLSTARDLNETTVQWMQRHKDALKGCVLDLPRY